MLSSIAYSQSNRPSTAPPENEEERTNRVEFLIRASHFTSIDGVSLRAELDREFNRALINRRATGHSYPMDKPWAEAQRQVSSPAGPKEPNLELGKSEEENATTVTLANFAFELNRKAKTLRNWASKFGSPLPSPKNPAKGSRPAKYGRDDLERWAKKVMENID
jgi:hypothetical protein